MPYGDPFDEETQPTEDTSVAQAPTGTATVTTPKAVAASTSGGLSVTLKGNGGYDSPWIVIHAADAADAVETLLDTETMKTLMTETASAAKFYAGLFGASKPQSGGAGGGGRAPQQAQEAPGGEERFCSHGKMEFRSGVAKSTGKPYSLFSCTAPRDQQCKAQFLK